MSAAPETSAPAAAAPSAANASSKETFEQAVAHALALSNQGYSKKDVYSALTSKYPTGVDSETVMQ